MTPTAMRIPCVLLLGITEAPCDIATEALGCFADERPAYKPSIMPSVFIVANSNASAPRLREFINYVQFRIYSKREQAYRYREPCLWGHSLNNKQ